MCGPNNNWSRQDRETRQHNSGRERYLSVHLSVYLSIFFFIYFPILVFDSFLFKKKPCLLYTKHHSGNILLNSRSKSCYFSLRIERKISNFVLQKMGLKLYTLPLSSLCFKIHHLHPFTQTVIHWWQRVPRHTDQRINGLILDVLTAGVELVVFFRQISAHKTSSVNANVSTLKGHLMSSR